MPARTFSRSIEGRHHPLVKELRAMVRSGDLFSRSHVLLETTRLIEDALSGGVLVPQLFVRAGAGPRVRGLMKLAPATSEVIEIAEAAFDSIGSTESSQGAMAFARVPQWTEDDLIHGTQTLIVLAAGIQDPGNLGSIFRSAEAFGATGLIATKGTAGFYNAKVVRAAAGSLLRLPALGNLSNKEAVSILSRRGIPLLAAVAGKEKALAEILLKGPLALAIGSEGAGLPPEIVAAGQPFTIPIGPKVESLNAAAAATAALYEIARQRAAR